jgi:hypothetical protein
MKILGKAGLDIGMLVSGGTSDDSLERNTDP